MRRVNEGLPEVSFRLNLLRYHLDLDTNPSLTSVVKYHSNLLGEYEQIAYRGRNKQHPTLKGLSAEVSTTTTSEGAESPSRTGASKVPCRFFMSDSGCKKGRSCTFKHDFVDKKDKGSRCWTCGSKQHKGKDCPRREEGPGSGGTPVTPKAKAKAQQPKPQPPPTLATAMATAKSSATPEPTATTEPASGSDGATVVVGEPVSPVEMKELMEQAQAMLKEMRQLKTMMLVGKGMRELRDPCELQDGTTGLLDSGASHPFRSATEEELRRAENVEVQLADGGSVVLKQGENGTLFPTTSGTSSKASPIVPLGALVEELGCDIKWNKEDGMVVTHPESGPIPTKVVGSCPTISEKQALSLIRELEERKMLALKKNTMETEQALKIASAKKTYQSLLQGYLASGCRTSLLAAINAEDSIYKAVPEQIKSTLAEDLVLDDKAGWKYLQAFPMNRRRRRRLMSSSWIVHICHGGAKSWKGSDQILEQDGMVVVRIDAEVSKAFGLRQMAGAYRALLWAAATGRVAGVVGGPPRWSGNRDEQMLKQMMVWEVARESAAGQQGRDPFFEGRVAMGGGELLGTMELWDEFAKGNWLHQHCATVSGHEERLVTTSSTRTSTSSRESLVEAIEEWKHSPTLVQLQALRPPRRFADMTDKELEYWKDHVRSGHHRFDKRCRTCVKASGTGRQHRRVSTPSSYVISYDVVGPLKECGEDIDFNDYRYALVAAYTYPKELAKPKEEEAEGENEPCLPKVEEEEVLEGGIRDLLEMGSEAEPNPEEEEEEEACRLANTISDEEYAKLFVEVGHGLEYETRYYVRPMRTRMAREVHPLVKEIFLEVRAEGFPVARAHADRARELRHQELKQWFAEGCADVVH